MVCPPAVDRLQQTTSPPTQLISSKSFQAATFNPTLNDRELGLAESIGTEHHAGLSAGSALEARTKGFVSRLDAFLTIAARHHIRPIRSAASTPAAAIESASLSPAPTHSRRSQLRLGPELGQPNLQNLSAELQLKEYVVGVDLRVCQRRPRPAWDIWNEPDNNQRQPLQPGEETRSSFDRRVCFPSLRAAARLLPTTQPFAGGVSGR